MTEQLKHCDKRIKELMEQVGYPNSMSLYQAFKQFQNELTTSQPAQAGEVSVVKDQDGDAHVSLMVGGLYFDCAVSQSGRVSWAYKNGEDRKHGGERINWPTQPAAQATPTSEKHVSVNVLSNMVKPIDGLDRNHPGFHEARGWNAALRQAMDYAQPAAQATPEPVLTALRETQEVLGVTQCPWCGHWGQGYADSERPADYCHHEYGLKPWRMFATPEPQQAAGEPFGWWFTEDPDVFCMPGSGFRRFPNKPQHTVECIPLFTHPAPAVPVTDADALLDFMEAHRVSVSPEYEGQWCARRYDDEPQAVASEEGATPRDALRALAAAQAKGGA